MQSTANCRTVSSATTQDNANSSVHDRLYDIVTVLLS